MSAAAGLLIALAIWILAQNFGGLYTGQATDPNTAPLVALLALALLLGEGRPQTVPGATRYPCGSQKLKPA